MSNQNKEELNSIHDDYINSWLLGIVILVGVIMVSCFLNETSSKNFVSSFSVEFRWILFPTLILLGIGIPSVEFLYKMEDGENEILNNSYKRYGYQWFWTYEKSDYNRINQENLSKERYILPKQKEDSFNYIRADVEIEVKNFSNINNIITSGDVIHRWVLPSIIIKCDAIPGRLNSLSFFLNSLSNEKHYGQCSELCGANHSFMPIVLKTN